MIQQQHLTVSICRNNQISSRQHTELSEAPFHLRVVTSLKEREIIQFMTWLRASIVFQLPHQVEKSLLVSLLHSKYMSTVVENLIQLPDFCKQSLLYHLEDYMRDSHFHTFGEHGKILLDSVSVHEKTAIAHRLSDLLAYHNIRIHDREMKALDDFTSMISIGHRLSNIENPNQRVVEVPDERIIREPRKLENIFQKKPVFQLEDPTKPYYFVSCTLFNQDQQSPRF